MSVVGEEVFLVVKRLDGLCKEFVEIWMFFLEFVIDGLGGWDKGGFVFYGIIVWLESKNIIECVGVECLD